MLSVEGFTISAGARCLGDGTESLRYIMELSLLFILDLCSLPSCYSRSKLMFPKCTHISHESFPSAIHNLEIIFWMSCFPSSIYLFFSFFPPLSHSIRIAFNSVSAFPITSSSFSATAFLFSPLLPCLFF